MKSILKELLEKYPRLANPELGARVAGVLNDAYGFDVATNPEVLGAIEPVDALDALEVLQAAGELAAFLVQSVTAGRISEVSTLKPPPKVPTP